MTTDLTLRTALPDRRPQLANLRRLYDRWAHDPDASPRKAYLMLLAIRALERE